MHVLMRAWDTPQVVSICGSDRDDHGTLVRVCTRDIATVSKKVCLYTHSVQVAEVDISWAVALQFTIHGRDQVQKTPKDSARSRHGFAITMLWLCSRYASW